MGQVFNFLEKNLEIHGGNIYVDLGGVVNGSGL